jgi:Asp-tRNA(Asn)/Glu-tRNA(Gln) amidotransferase A subunit family amidase
VVTDDGRAAGDTLRSLAEAVREGRRTAVELVELSLARIAEHADLGAVVALDADRALEQARAVDAGEAPQGPLSGLPLLVKDNMDVAGLRTTHGSRLLADAAPAATDAPTVRRLRAAGAIVVGKTNLPEFSIEGFTANRLFGTTRNPWVPELSPGGSSGGSAAALAASLAPIATGTDGGGSVRIPAAWCGLLGYKPTNGVIGRAGVRDWIDFDTDGFMAATVEDLRLLLEIVAGPVAGDPTALPTALPRAAAPTRLIAAERTDDLGPLPADVARAFAAAVAALCDVLHMTPEWWAPTDFFAGHTGGSPDQDWFTLATAEHLAAFGRDRAAALAEDLHPSTREFFEVGAEITIDDYLAARRRRFAHIARLDAILGSDALLLTPTVAVAGVSADGRGPNGESGLLPAATYSTAVQNLTGLPAISLPAGTTANGLPFGLQVTAPRWGDHALLDLASRWEKASPWPRTALGFSPFH